LVAGALGSSGSGGSEGGGMLREAMTLRVRRIGRFEVLGAAADDVRVVVVVAWAGCPWR